MEFVGGLITGLGIGLMFGGLSLVESEHDLNDCAKKYDVYECELAAVPKGDDNGMATY